MIKPAEFIHPEDAAALRQLKMSRHKTKQYLSIE